MAVASRRLRDLQSQAANKICVDYTQKNLQWASVSYNVFMCLECVPPGKVAVMQICTDSSHCHVLHFVTTNLSSGSSSPTPGATAMTAIPSAFCTRHSKRRPRSPASPAAAPPTPSPRRAEEEEEG
ncbi:uncharacterized protein LOC128194991 [Vigna angularis]|uniref:uncharacterized protein LOC128194991 n=1 Tax=Phaseolus angularis TaxID=3914 RepID=UPI0022B2CA8C|nr:uncharacterized protein LOC128194991 [Vigna angularis]